MIFSAKVTQALQAVEGKKTVLFTLAYIAYVILAQKGWIHRDEMIDSLLLGAAGLSMYHAVRRTEQATKPQ